MAPLAPPGYAYEGGCRYRGLKCGVSYCPTTSLSIGDPPIEPHFCSCCQMNWWVVVRRAQMGVSIWDAVHSHSMDSELWVEQMAPWHGVLDTMWLLCDEAQQVGYRRLREDRKIVRWCRTEAFSHSSKTSLITRSVRWVWALRHQTGTQ